MTTHLKGLGLLVAALLSLCGLMATVASASTFTSESSVTTLRGEKDPGTSGTVFTVTGQQVTCTTEEIHGVAVGTSLESMTIEGHATGCTAFGFVNASVTGGCDAVMKASGTADLSCPVGQDVTIEASTCVTHIPAQTNLGTISYTTGTRNVKHDLTLEINLSGITTSHTDGFACPLPSGGESSTATLVGKETIWGEDGGGSAVGITWDA